MDANFLEHLAHLFYAVAKADRNLSFEEYVKLSESLERHWSHIGNDNIAQIKANFNMLQKENIPAELCFNAFIEYLHQNPNVFNNDLKKLIFKTANEIAYAFAKINKSELKFMAKLSLEFKKVEP